MRKVLCIVAMLVAALAVSADLPRAGPDRVDSIAAELNFAGDLVVDLAAIAEWHFVADYKLKSNFVADLTAASFRREEVVHQNPSDVRATVAYKADVSGYLTTFRDRHEPQISRPLLT